MTNEEETKIQRSNGRAAHDYNLWRKRAEIALRGKGYWSKITAKDFPQDIKDKVAATVCWLRHLAMQHSAYVVLSSPIPRKCLHFSTTAMHRTGQLLVYQ